MSSIVEPVLIFQMINNMFTYFDRLTEEFNTEKITTIGDAYVACSSLEADADPSLGAVSVCLVALQMQSFVMETFNESPFMKAKVNQKCRMRIGVHSGPCHGSIVGGSTNFRYDLIGATVDIAEKIQEQCEPGEVFISAATKRLVEIYKGFEMTEKGLCTSGQELFLLRMIRRKELPEVPPETNVNI
ncbi:nucleotide cyclase [Zopfochytrium polystomum]|nr:nucleotide cyclase [Zopfochytrium polystomum]